MTVTLWHERNVLEAVSGWKTCFLLQTSPEEGAGSSIHESLRTGRTGAPGTCVGGSQPLLAGRLGGMTSSLPVSATEALLFQPLGRHYAMLSLKVKGRAAFAWGSWGAPSWEGLRGKAADPLPWLS